MRRTTPHCLELNWSRLLTPIRSNAVWRRKSSAAGPTLPHPGVMTEDRGMTGCRTDQAQRDFDQGALAAAVGTDDGKGPSRRKVEADVAQRFDPTETDRYVVNVYRRVGLHGHSLRRIRLRALTGLVSLSSVSVG